MITVALAILLAAPQAAAPAAPPPAHIDHVALAVAVADVDATAAFDQRLVGLAEPPSPVKGPRWLDLGDGVQLHLFPGRTAPPSPERRTHLALAVSGFDAFVQRLT